MNTIETPRLLLRAWSDDDIAPFFSMNQDPKVMEYIANFWTMDMVASFIERMNAQLAEKNYTLWAVEEKSTQEFMGFIGLNSPAWEAHFTPCVEIGWRLAFSFWGKGYATEGAQAVLNYAFNTLKLKEVVAFTVPENLRSQRVMEKLGMIRDRYGDFLHPKIDPVNSLAKHYLFRIKNNPD
ncbi:GNAT family N-acetyltransferase [Legionella qingyii]|uniref:N-acetyltransferase n=1 Tax=Legionella qingyii TaxID=2184757 RepID=A0A317U2N2_9GAMM|nr:GNAT family N-acetyltransferase [Legionella qingyii]PWY55609.1 GNAT family N-acetyltransferase [Legionella qingyii]RUR21796.1 N-acetyltransferase [Legionella qingyii]RUR25276.1 N-acetyltransferase [Legionella qingyii]